jgi:DNA-binding winged helix-turn-helix (wHTH) protein
MSEPQPLRVRFDVFELDEADARLKRRGQALELPLRAYSVLCELARRPGQLVTKDALLDAVWGHRHVSESVLKSAISQLRTALEDDAKAPRVIETASRRGYRFIATLETPDASPASHRVESDVAMATGTRPPERAPVVPMMTGRSATMARLHAAWHLADAGQRRLCWLAGEAGIGKTTLVENFAASLGPVAVAHGQCVEQHGTGEPYLPALEALASLTRQDPAMTPLLRSVAPTWLFQLPWLCSESEREGLRRELAGTSQDRMLREFGELLDRYTQDRPLLLVTEDLHWSDHATVNLINHVARRRGPARWMWLATFRVAEVIAEDHPMKALRHELRLHRLAEEILVDPFSEQELADYVARRLECGEWSDAFLQALHRHTDGLPLFVANVIDDLQARGALREGPLDAQGAFQALSVPESLAGVMERQLLRLPPEQTAVLEAASACGVEFRPSVVAQVLGKDTDWVGQQCDSLARAQQWLTATQVERSASGELEARYAFRHALVRHVFHDRLGALARAEMHRRVASTLAQAAAAGAATSAAEIATQFELGQDPDAALPYCAAAAANAMKHFSPADALRLADRGLELARQCRPGPAVQELLATLHTLRGGAIALVRGVSADETLQAFERAQAAMADWPHHPLRSLALHGLGLGLFLRGGTTLSRPLVEAALAEARVRDDDVMIVTACDLLGQITKREGPHHESIAALEEGLSVVAALDDHTLQSAFVLDPLVNMRAALAIPLLMAGYDQRSRVESDLALERARALKQPMAHMIATWLRLLCDIRRGDRDQVARLADELRRITDEGALASGVAPSQWFAGMAQVWAGRLSEGHAQIIRGYRHNVEMGMLYGGAEVLGYATEALVLGSDWSRATQQVDEALALSAKLQDHSYLVELLLLKRRIQLGEGDDAAARKTGDLALQEARRQQSPWLEMTVLIDLCDGSPPAHDHVEALRNVIRGMPEPSNCVTMRRALALASMD